MLDLSIVIPSFNRRDPLCRLVTALLTQSSADSTVEIVVVLDGSTDGSAEALAALEVPAGANLIVHTRPNGGPAAARNTGIALASGPIVLFLDDDMQPGPQLLEAHLAAYRGNEAGAVIGRIKSTTGPMVPPTVATIMERLFNDQHQRLSADGAVVTAIDVFTGNLSVTRQRLVEVGGFDESLTGLGGEDADLGHRLIAAGTAFVYRPDAVATHHCEFSASQWRRRIWLEGQGQVRLSLVRPALTPYMDLDTLHEGRLRRRLAAQLAIQFPRLGRAVSAVPFWILPLARRAGQPASLQLTYMSQYLAFWSGARSALGSARAARAGRTFPARILAYHRVSDRPNPGLERYAISRRAFRWQMALLRWLGYRCLNLRELVEALEAGEPVAKKTVVLTFDDGYLDTVTEAAPVLQGYGFRATVFAVTAGVGRTAEWDAGYGGEQAPLATWEQLRALQDSGWEVGFHTATHPDLTTLSDNELAEEVVEGKAVFERALGSPVSTIAYPFGEFTPAVVAAARRSGVRAAVAGDGDTDRGAWVTHRSPRYALPRYIIRGSDSLVDLLLLVTIGHRTAPFDWPAVRLPKRGMRLLPGLGRRG